MKDNSLYKLGGIASILVGISYVVVGITTILTPPAVAGVPNAQATILFFEDSEFLILTNWWALLIGAVFALAMIPAVSATVQHLNEGWVRWTSTLATIAFAVVTVDNYWPIVYTEARARAYETGTEAVRAALSIPGSPQWIDVQGWLAYGAVGLWLLVISLLVLRSNIWPWVWLIWEFSSLLFTSWRLLPQSFQSLFFPVRSSSLQASLLSSRPSFLPGWDYICGVSVQHKT